MKAMLSAFAAIAVIAVVANFGLKEAGFSAVDATTSSSVRPPEPKETDG